MAGQTISIRDYPAPASYVHENIALGALISNPSFIPEARRYISEESFADPENAKLWRILVKMDDDREDIDPAKMYLRCNSQHYLDKIFPNCKGFESVQDVFAKIGDLVEVARRRAGYFAAVAMIQAATTGNSEKIVSEASKFMELVNVEREDNETKSVRDAVNDLADTYEKREKDAQEGRVLRVPTGFRTVDFLTYGGWANGNLVILAARPSVGKTAVMLQMARSAANAGIHALVFSLEMTNDELVQRMIRANSNLSGNDLARGKIDWTAFDEATGRFVDLPLWFNDRSSYADDILAKITEACRKRRCGVVFIDYGGLVSYRDNKSNLVQQISDFTKRIKRLAKEMRIPIVLLWQLNRDMSKEGRKPQLHDLRDSGSLEQDADIVLMLERDLTDDTDTSRMVNMYVRKNRQGRVGDCIKLEADETFCNFIDHGNDG